MTSFKGLPLVMGYYRARSNSLFNGDDYCGKIWTYDLRVMRTVKVVSLVKDSLICLIILTLWDWMRLFLHPVSLLSPHKHRISISSSNIFGKSLRVFAVSINKHQRLRNLGYNLRCKNPKIFSKNFWTADAYPMLMGWEQRDWMQKQSHSVS